MFVDSGLRRGGGAPGSFPASFAGVTVTLNGIASPLMYISSQQINLQAPFLAGLGVTVPAPVTGSINSSSGTPLNLPITFGNGLAAAVVSAVALPGSISGVWQVDIRMPGETGAIPVSLLIDAVPVRDANLTIWMSR